MREKIISKKNRRKKIRNRKILLSVCSMFIVVSLTGFFSVFLTSAHDNRADKPVNYTYYKSIEIQPGDSLWRIAETYMSDDYDSVESYIDELKRINSLRSDNIQESKYLMVAYNDTNFR